MKEAFIAPTKIPFKNLLSLSKDTLYSDLMTLTNLPANAWGIGFHQASLLFLYYPIVYFVYIFICVIITALWIFVLMCLSHTHKLWAPWCYSPLPPMTFRWMNEDIHVQSPYCLWQVVVNFGYSLQSPGNFKKYWCLCLTHRYSELIGLGGEWPENKNL